MKSINDITIHESRWAISKKIGNKVIKVFLHDNYRKIIKEVDLLNLSLNTKASLSYDINDRHWVCESNYINLHKIDETIPNEKIILELSNIFKMWDANPTYLDLVSDEWSKNIVPWYCSLLKQYISFPNEYIMWLQNSQNGHFVHGDFTLSNVYFDDSGKIAVIDYENATIGPYLWDETTFVFSMIENKQYQRARYLFETFSCSRTMLRVIGGIRLAQSIRKAQNEKTRFEAYNHITKNY